MKEKTSKKCLAKQAQSNFDEATSALDNESENAI